MKMLEGNTEAKEVEKMERSENKETPGSKVDSESGKISSFRRRAFRGSIRQPTTTTSVRILLFLDNFLSLFVFLNTGELFTWRTEF